MKSMAIENCKTYDICRGGPSGAAPNGSCSITFAAPGDGPFKGRGTSTIPVTAAQGRGEPRRDSTGCAPMKRNVYPAELARSARAVEPEVRGAMAKPTKMPADAAAGLTVRERMLLFCAESGTDWQHAGVPGETVTAMMVKGFVSRNTAGEVALTDSGRAVLRALLPDL
jgi:hypothetical protein